MDFSIPESLQTVLPAVRDLLERSVMPLEPRLSSRPFAELVPALASVRETVKARGLWTPQLPRSLGGLGLGLLEFALVAEELGAAPWGTTHSTARPRTPATWSCSGKPARMPSSKPG